MPASENPERTGVPQQTVLEFRFKEKGFTEGWEPGQGTQELDVAHGLLRLHSASGGASVIRPVDIEASSVSHLILTMAVTRGDRAEVHWEAAGCEKEKSKRYSLAFPVRSGDLLHRYQIALAGQAGWKGRLAWLALRPTNAPAQVAIADIRLVREYPPLAQGAMPSTEAPLVTVGEETRQGIIAPAPSRVRWATQVPPQHPLLRVGYGVLPEAWEKTRDGVGFVVSAQRGTEQRQLFKAFLHPASDSAHRRWFDTEIDLSRFAGRQITLVFDTVGSNPLAGTTAQGNTRYDWAVWSLPQVRSGDSRPQQPNVVIILLDSLRADHLGCYGYWRPTSPNIDRLAAQGVRFTQAMSQTPWTPPSVGSLLTSLYPHEAVPVQTHLDPPPGSATLPEVLARCGYTTGTVSSHDWTRPALGFGRGIRYFLATDDTAEACARGVATWLERHAQQPFFLYVHCFDPHHHYWPPPAFRDRFLAGLRTRNQWVRAGDPLMFSADGQAARKRLSKTELAYLMALYDADIAYADAQVGQMLAALERLGLRRRTLIAVLADHGEEFLEHGGLAHGKTLYQELLHVPLIIAFPENRYRGRVVDQVVRLLDVAPTVLEVAGLPIPQSMRGQSLLATLDGTWVEPPAMGEWADMTGPWQCTRALRLSVRQGNQKVIRNPDGRWEAYDLALDPEEQHNLVKRNEPPAGPPALIEQFRASIAQPLTGARKAMHPEALETMRALGYLR